MKPDLDPQAIIEEWQKAYKLSNGKEPPVMTYAFGWYHVGFSRYRRNKVVEFINTLNERAKHAIRPKAIESNESA